MASAVIALAVLATVVGGWLLLRGGHPEDAATHDDGGADDSTSERLYRGTHAPAGPDAEGAGDRLPEDG